MRLALVQQRSSLLIRSWQQLPLRLARCSDCQHRVLAAQRCGHRPAAGRRSRKLRKPNVVKRRLFSQALGRKVQLHVTTTALKCVHAGAAGQPTAACRRAPCNSTQPPRTTWLLCPPAASSAVHVRITRDFLSLPSLRYAPPACRAIDRAGGLDRYLLKTPDSLLFSDKGSNLKFQIGLIHRHQQWLQAQQQRQQRREGQQALPDAAAVAAAVKQVEAGSRQHSLLPPAAAAALRQRPPQAVQQRRQQQQR